jgi:hypothetical protein
VYPIAPSQAFAVVIWAAGVAKQASAMGASESAITTFLVSPRVKRGNPTFWQGERDSGQIKPSVRHQSGGLRAGETSVLSDDEHRDRNIGLAKDMAAALPSRRATAPRRAGRVSQSWTARRRARLYHRKVCTS